MHAAQTDLQGQGSLGNWPCRGQKAPFHSEGPLGSPQRYPDLVSLGLRSREGGTKEWKGGNEGKGVRDVGCLERWERGQRQCPWRSGVGVWGSRPGSLGGTRQGAAFGTYSFFSCVHPNHGAVMWRIANMTSKILRSRPAPHLPLKSREGVGQSVLPTFLAPNISAAIWQPA